jgi:hypothetical protein
MSDAQEFIAGTDPRDPASLLKVDLHTGAGTTTLSFIAAAGRSYSVLFKHELSDPAWQKLRDVAAQPAAHTEQLDDITGGADGCFYRLVTPALP